jgi:outer membrane lipoprotein SlyB
MKALRIALIATLPVLSMTAVAGDLTTDAAIGGALGGAVGGALGAEVGGRDGAILGAGVGAAAGTAINTKDHEETRHRDYDGRDSRRYYEEEPRRRSGHFCPPGQAKKGNC